MDNSCDSEQAALGVRPSGPGLVASESTHCELASPSEASAEGMLGAVHGGEGELREGENSMSSTCFIFYCCTLYFCSYSVHSLRGSLSVAS
jgi:hypothetical protein